MENPPRSHKNTRPKSITALSYLARSLWGGKLKTIRLLYQYCHSTSDFTAAQYGTLHLTNQAIGNMY